MEWSTQDMDGVLKVHLAEVILPWVFVLVKPLIYTISVCTKVCILSVLNFFSLESYPDIFEVFIIRSRRSVGLNSVYYT